METYIPKNNLDFCYSGEGISKSQITATWRDTYSRKRHADIETLIEEIWTVRRKENEHLYDAPKFRLKDVRYEDIRNGRPLHVHFLLGTTSYKDFIGTNCTSHIVKVLREKMLLNSSDIQEYMADPLGVGSLLETTDHKFVFIRRSNICAEAQGMVDRPGGHPEPENIKLSIEKESDEIISAAVVQEIFSSVQCEIRDEVNIPIEKLAESVLLGIVYNKQTYSRPSLEFYTRCSITSKEVQKEYMKQTQAEKDESTELIFVSSSELLSLNHQQTSLSQQFTQSAQGAIKMFAKFDSYHHL